MDFLKRFYDKIALGLLLLLLATSMTLQTCSLQKARDEVKISDEDLIEVIQNKPPVAEIDLSTMAARVEVTKVRLWQKTEGEGSLFDPARYVVARDHSPYMLHYSTKRNPFTGTPDIGDESLPAAPVGDDDDDDGAPKDDSDNDGMPDSYEKTYGLNPNDPADAREDADGDGFANAEERAYKTLPNSPKSRPRLITVLRFYKEVTTPLPIILKRVTAMDQQDISTWELSVKAKIRYRGKYRFRDYLSLRVGSEIPGTGYKIVSARSSEGGGLAGTVYEIDIQKGEAEPITLHKGRQAAGPDKLYELLYFLDPDHVKRLRVAADADFTLQDLHGAREQYKLLVSEEGIQGEYLKDGSRYPLKKASKRDRQRIRKKKTVIAPRPGGVMPGPGVPPGGMPF